MIKKITEQNTQFIEIQAMKMFRAVIFYYTQITYRKEKSQFLPMIPPVNIIVFFDFEF